MPRNVTGPARVLGCFFFTMWRTAKDLYLEGLECAARARILRHETTMLLEVNLFHNVSWRRGEESAFMARCHKKLSRPGIFKNGACLYSSFLPSFCDSRLLNTLFLTSFSRHLASFLHIISLC